MTNVHYSCETVARLSFASLDTDTCAVTGFADTGAYAVFLSIPERAPDGRRVVAVAESAFDGCDSLRIVTLPDTVESIGRRAFAVCTGLIEVRVGQASRLSTIGNRAFMGCENLSVLRLGHLSGLRFIDNRAFAYCTHLRCAVLPDSLSALPDGLFEGCRRLVQVRLPGRLSRIGRSAFAACVSLEAVRLPDSVALIEDTAFAWCASLHTVLLPVSPCIVAASAFSECPDLPPLPELLGVG